MRISFNHPYINLTLGSRDKFTGAVTSIPEHKPGFELKADSGVYRYLQATSATSEGYGARFIRSGFLTSNFGATPLLTADVTLPVDVGAVVTAGGLAANQWGWYWLGEGEDFLYMASTCQGGMAGGNVGAFTSAGQFFATSTLAQASGKIIADVMVADSNTSSGLRLCRASRLMVANFTTNPN